MIILLTLIPSCPNLLESSEKVNLWHAQYYCVSVNDEFNAWKGIYSNGFCWYALVIFSSRSLLLTLLAWHKYFTALVT